MQSYQSEPQTNSRSRTIIISVATVALIGLALLAYTLTQAGQSDQTNNAAETTDQVNQTATEPNAADGSVNENGDATASYRAGSYSATGSYSSPGGTESIAITLSVTSDGIVESASATAQAKNPTAKDYQRRFISGFEDQVVGKDIDSLRLGRVSGSSLTPNGFNDALADIKQDARSNG